jgi:neural Wiskott-Aldrich syndrome protein
MPQPFADEVNAIQFSSKLGESLERARVFAREQSHRAVLLEHLLLALTEDPDASAVMQACNVDPVRLGTDVSGYLGRLLEDMRAPAGVEPSADAELLRVLQAAGQAAQQSRRRQIDGAIVLAAIVGDGRSPAAGLLKAHGLTFEEAIRALQKANTSANAKARSQLYAPPVKPAATAPAPASAPAPSADPEPLPTPQGDGDDPETAAQTAQSVDEILAAARARIQQRTAAMVAKPEVKPQSPLVPPQPAPPAEGGPLPLATLTSASPPPPVRPPEPKGTTQGPEPSPEGQPPAPPTLQAPPGSSWAPPPGPPGAPHRAQPGPRRPPPRPPAGFPDRPPSAGAGPPHPPAPPRPRPDAPPPQLGHPGGPPQPGLSTRPQQPPWQHPPPPGHPGPPARNGALAEPARSPARPRASQRTGGQGGGPLVETIPRRMRLGKPMPAQVRIARDKIDGLIALLLSGRGMAHRSDTFVTRALSVRLRAPDGGFAIEPGSPETQWVETTPGLQHDEFVNWRWTVTPQRRGRGRLLLIVTARTVGRDGLATETAPPDRVIEVSVKGGRLRGLARWTGRLVVLLLGVAIGRFGNEFWALGTALLKRIAGG